ncbi:hypothetical protein J6590_044822 [Homalodisca vitripennis]|nr:hypothetical protein J6590_044822 [Homalodisca vitripennis]
MLAVQTEENEHRQYKYTPQQHKQKWDTNKKIKVSIFCGITLKHEGVLPPAVTETKSKLVPNFLLRYNDKDIESAIPIHQVSTGKTLIPDLNHLEYTIIPEANTKVLLH